MLKKFFISNVPIFNNQAISKESNNINININQHQINNKNDKHNRNFTSRRSKQKRIKY